MTIKEFIEAAIEGGWDINGLTGQMNYGYEWKKNPFRQGDYLECWDDIGNVYPLDLNMMALDPKAWKAVGKVKGWRYIDDVNPFSMDTKFGSDEYMDHTEWERKFTNMNFALVEGKTLEEYIATL